MRRLRAALLLALWPLAVPAAEPRPFDYWILALSWSPQHCAQQPRADDRQCGGRGYGFVVHGLWPQYQTGYPQHCGKPGALSQRLVERMLPLMPSTGLIRHQWNKHGSCTGRSAPEYFAAVEAAHRKIKIPSLYEGIGTYLNTTPAELERQFMLFNPGYAGNHIALQCRGRYLSEIRLCMDRDFSPRPCGADVADRCGARVILRPAK